MTNLAVFNFEGQEVRCYGTPERPVWVAADICTCLDLINNRQALARLDQDEKDVILVDTLGGEQEMLGVTEPGLYSLVLSCRKPAAKRFKRWVTHDVLPRIRKTGKYELNKTRDGFCAPKEIADSIDAVLSIAGIDKPIIAGVAANEIGKAHPQLKSHMEAAKKLLPLPVEDELLTATNLAKKYIETTGQPLSKKGTDQANAIAMNKLLLALGLQSKNQAKGDAAYLPTELGKAHSKLVLQEGKDSNKTCQQLRWYPSVLGLLPPTD